MVCRDGISRPSSAARSAWSLRLASFIVVLSWRMSCWVSWPFVHLGICHPQRSCLTDVPESRPRVLVRSPKPIELCLVQAPESLRRSWVARETVSGLPKLPQLGALLNDFSTTLFQSPSWPPHMGQVATQTRRGARLAALACALGDGASSDFDFRLIGL